MNTVLKKVILSFFLTVSFHQTQAESLIDFLTARDLELVNSVNQTHSGIVANIDRVQTVAGKALLRTMLMQPTSDREVLIEHQNAIKTLVHNPALLNRIKALLAPIAEREQGADFFNPESVSPTLSSVLESFQYKFGFLQRFNDSPCALDMRHITHSFSPLITAIFEFFVLHFALEYLTGKVRGESHHHGDDHHEHSDDCGCIHHMQPSDDASWIVKALVMLAKGGHIALHLVSIKDMVEFISAKMAVMNHVYEALQSLNSVVRSSQTLHSILGADATLAGIVDANAIQDLAKLFPDDYFDTMHDEGLDLLSSVGITLVAYNQAQKKFGSIAQLTNGIALLDVYCSLATLIQESSNSATPFCFAEFVDTVQPHLEMVNGWHVLLAKDKAIANSLCATEDTACKFVLSGPNWSGKSSLLRTVGLNTVLAQSFGIAAAEKFVLKPFSKILSFMTIADDITTQQSSFVARMVRTDYCLEQQMNLDLDKAALVLLDDSVGQGTVAERGEACALEFIKQIGSYANNIVFAATHFDKIKALGKDGTCGYKNIRMRVTVDDDGGAHGAYVVENGVSDASQVGLLTS